MRCFNFSNLDIRKFFGILIGSISFIYCILFFTYAYYEWKSVDTNVVFNIDDLNSKCFFSEDIEALNLGPVLNLEDGVKSSFIINNLSDVDMAFSLSLEIELFDSELENEAFKYALVVDTDGGSNYDYNTPILEGDFDLLSKDSDSYNSDTGVLVIADTDEGTVNISSLNIVANSTYSYQFIVYIDGSVYNNSNMQGKSFVGGLIVAECEKSESSSDDSLKPNVPNLDNGSLIPVYYDDNEEVWKKADSSNGDNSWYDYSNKRWANAVLVNSTTLNSSYNSVDVGTTISDSDILAFYVWIPRYKYRVWNITRQGDSEDNYAYSAFSKGIEIVWETDTETTGNVLCNYNISASESTTSLSDDCYYNGSDVAVSTSDNNSDYSDAWYTHPAFTYGDVKKTGFWIGKFETGGSSSSPKVVPDVVSLQEQSVSEQFTTSKFFQNYLSTSMDAHMVTNLEWGALAYLTYSVYGLCDNESCSGLNHNNSEGFFTGRSGGDIALNVSDLATVYGDTSTNSTYWYNNAGYYNYKGYFLDSAGNVTTTKDITKVASTTNNITGVYDISGGAIEYVMGNMVDSTGNFYASSAGSSWNGSSSLSSMYYSSYSYGTAYYNIKAFNRARLGDATAEVIGGTSSTSAWQPGSDIEGVSSLFINYSSSRITSWFVRGGRYNATRAGIFNFDRATGAAFTNYSFRSSLI